MIEIINLRKSFESGGKETAAINDISISVPEGEFFTLLGPSGCGKSTTLRCVAGLEKPDSGTIKIGGETVFSSAEGIVIPAYQRDIGMVFQSYAIWPHMTVLENVAYPLKINRRPKEEVRARAMKALATVGLDGLEDRPAPLLSGGQQQRVSLARALIKEPKVLLLDEPLSNLDAKLREQMRFEIKELQQRVGITTLYVTHDQTEALAISDSIAVMSHGKLLDVASPREIYSRPSCEFTADFIGLTNTLRGTFREESNGLARLSSAVGPLLAPMTAGAHPGDEFLIFVRPEDLSVTDAPSASSSNNFEGVVQTMAFLGEMVDCQILVGTTMLRARLHPKSRIEKGQRVYLEADPHSLIMIRP